MRIECHHRNRRLTRRSGLFCRTDDRLMPTMQTVKVADGQYQSPRQPCNLFNIINYPHNAYLFAKHFIIPPQSVPGKVLLAFAL
jgi:hypothetical protein